MANHYLQFLLKNVKFINIHHLKNGVKQILLKFKPLLFKASIFI